MQLDFDFHIDCTVIITTIACVGVNTPMHAVMHCTYTAIERLLQNHAYNKIKVCEIAVGPLFVLAWHLGVHKHPLCTRIFYTAVFTFCTGVFHNSCCLLFILVEVDARNKLVFCK